MIDILIKYWSQITVLIGITIGGFGYLLRNYFDWTIKKKEITFSRIREVKINELKKFYESYFELEFHLKSLHFAAAQDNKDYEIEISNRMPELWRQFYRDFTFLRIFLSTAELIQFEKLSNILNNIHRKIDEYQFNREYQTYDTELISELRTIRDEVFPKQIPELLKVIEGNLKADFEIS